MVFRGGWRGSAEIRRVKGGKGECGGYFLVGGETDFAPGGRWSRETSLFLYPTCSITQHVYGVNGVCRLV
jgi:hypothetical protein